MLASQDQDHQGAVAQAKTRKRSHGIAGVVLMLLGVALMAYGAHYLTKSGNCSGTGYTSYGPVPKCSDTETLSIVFAFFLGPAVALVGWLMATVSGVLWPAFCIAMAIGLITLREDPTAATGAKAFGLVIGVCFAALAVLSVVVTLRKRGRPKAAPGYIDGSGTGLAGPGTGPVPSTSLPHRAAPQGRPTASGPGADPLDTIAKLARLRDSGAITEEEYESQKAKLLSQM